MTQLLDITNSQHLEYASKLIAQGEIIVAGFNGVFGIFGDADCEHANDKIFEAKNRPADKNLILVSSPEFLAEHVNLKTTSKYYSFEKLKRLYQEAHALGMILPAAIPGAPSHLVKNDTILNIWTEYLPYRPIRKLISHLRRKGKRALVGTSANKNGKQTCADAREVVEVFNGNVAAILLDSFEHLPAYRRKSTTVVDFTEKQPRLHREGNVPESEIRRLLRQLDFPELIIGPEIFKVRGHEEKV